MPFKLFADFINAKQTGPQRPAMLPPYRNCETYLERVATTKFCHTAAGKFGMPENPRCDHCEEEFPPD